MPKEEQLFYKLEPEGCWHQDVVRLFDPRTLEYTGFWCPVCCDIGSEAKWPEYPTNPDFSTWDGFGWMIERLKLLDDIFYDFFWDGAKWVAGVCSLGDEDDMIYAHDKDLPTALFNALCEYHGIGEKE